MAKPKRNLENAGLLDLYYERELKPIINAINQARSAGSFGSGRFNGAGRTTRWDDETDTFNNVNFNQAFDAAVERNMPMFVFDSRVYNTRKENNPVREYNNRWVGQNRRPKPNPSKTYDKAFGPLRGNLNLIPIVTDTYKPNR